MGRSLAVDHVDGQSSEGCFFVFRLHIDSGLSHGFDDSIQGDEVFAISVEDSESCGVDGFGRAHGVAFDAGDLDESGDRIAGQSEVVFHADFGGVFYLVDGSAHACGESGGGHGASHTDLTLATHFRGRERGISFVEHADGTGGFEEPMDTFSVRDGSIEIWVSWVWDEVDVVA